MPSVLIFLSAGRELTSILRRSESYGRQMHQSSLVNSQNIQEFKVDLGLYKRVVHLLWLAGQVDRRSGEP